MIRGINRKNIFEDDENCEKFLQILGQYKEKSGYKVFAYCFMGNHLHFMLKVGSDPLEQVMRRICGNYVYWYNLKYKRMGTLFQDRFKSEPVENDTYFMAVLRHIHQNAKKALVEKDIAKYKWSSYNEYEESSKIVDTDYALSILKEDGEKEVQRFVKYCNEDNNDVCLEIEEKHRIYDDEAREIITKICEVTNPTELQCLDIYDRNKSLNQLKEYGLSIRQIERLTGINRGVVFKAWSNTEDISSCYCLNQKTVPCDKVGSTI